MSSAVLDASAVLAVLNQEPGTEQLTAEILRTAVGSTVNLAEVQGKLVSDGMPPDKAWEATLNSVSQAVAFTSDQAKMAGSLIAETRSLGLSLGDRACLALALERKAPVYTTDRAWKKLKLTIPIHVIR
jgi:PIN domain nuclease of toxin-antitoxin system